MIKQYSCRLNQDHLTLLVPLGDFTKQIALDTRTAYDKLKQSKEIYAEAEALLLQELGLDALDLSDELTYERNFNEVALAGRYDAEFYQPKYFKLLEVIKKKNESNVWKVLQVKDISEPLKYGSSTKLEYIDEGVPFLRIADLTGDSFEEESLKYISSIEAEEEKGAQVKTNDVLISRSGTLGLAVPIPSKLNKSIFGSYFIRIRPNSTDVSINPDYLALFLNSLAGRLQTAQSSTGGVQTNLTIPVIENFLIAIPDENIQERLIEKISESRLAREQAKQLLEDAKRRVEDMILGA